MTTDFKKVKVDRDRLINAIGNAIQLINEIPNTDISEEERRDAEEKLRSALQYLITNSTVSDLDILRFFDNTKLTSDQMVRALLVAKEKKATRLHAFLSVPREQMEEKFRSGAKGARVSYPKVLRALYHAYHLGS